MSWRTVVISKRAKLDLHLNHMVVRGEETTKIFLGDISVLIIETTAVSITACLLNELIKQMKNVIPLPNWCRITAVMIQAIRFVSR